MKKTLLVLALAAMMIFAFASSAMAKNAGSAAVSGSGYATWSTVVSVASGGANATEENSGPHSNYAVSTIKCAVCHSMHGAPADTFLLTRATNAGAGTTAGQVCSYCHGIGATAGAHIVAINQGEPGSPHSAYCYTKCHAGVHGRNVSSYSVLATKLLRNGADAGIATAITNSDDTSVTAALMTQPVGTASATQLAMATGYVCAQSGCHTGSAFAIQHRGNSMTTLGGRGVLSGHPVIQDARADWQAPAGTSWNTGAAGSVVSENGVAYGPLQVAFKATNGCDTCHDYQNAATTDGTAFPHNKDNTNIWLTKASNASLADQSIVQNSDIIDSSTSTIMGLADNFTTVQDGICLKCHVSSDGASGVGITF